MEGGSFNIFSFKKMTFLISKKMQQQKRILPEKQIYTDGEREAVIFSLRKRNI